MHARRSLAVFCLLVLAGCGSSTIEGSDPDSDRSASSSEPAASTPAANAEVSPSATPGASRPASASSSASGGAGAQPSSAGGAPPAGASRYTDARYGFTATIPQGFTQAGTVQDRGRQFSGPNRVTVKVYGSQNLLHSSAEELCQQQAEAYRSDGASATSRFAGNRCTVTATFDGMSYQLETWVGPVTLNHVEVSYPDASAGPGRDAFAQVVGGFTPGDLAAAH